MSDALDVRPDREMRQREVTSASWRAKRRLNEMLAVNGDSEASRDSVARCFASASGSTGPRSVGDGKCPP